MLSDLIAEMGRIREHIVYLALFMSFACAFVLNHYSGSTSRGINGFFLFVLVALAAAAGMKLTGASITGDRDFDAVFVMVAAMMACVVAMTVLIMLSNALERRPA
jgi:hypothetical protein